MLKKLIITFTCVLGLASYLISEGTPASVAENTPALINIPDQLVFDDKRFNELLAAIDLTLPELKSVKSAVDAGDLPAAKHALAQYLRERRNITWKVDPHNLDRKTSYNVEVAENALEGRVLGGLVRFWKTFPANNIDWTYNETQHNPDLFFNPEWQWQLTRMEFWRDMARAYNQTNDERYPKAWVTQLRTFMLQCPPPGKVDNSHGSAWRTIEAGLRMSTAWPEAFHRFLLSPSVTDTDLLLYMYSSLEHGRHLRKLASRNNWLTMEMNGLYTTGSVFPEFKEAQEWRQYAIGRMYAETKGQFLDDGAQVELTPGYHFVSLNSLINIVSLADTVGRRDEIPDDYMSRLESAYDFALSLTTPDRSMPKFNNSWPVPVARHFRRVQKFFPEREDFLWVSSEGKRGKEPEITSLPLWNSGYFVMRSDWGQDANFAVLDAGPLGAAHVHQDKLNLVIWAYGREILFDSGGTSYEHSKWRDYGVDGYSHNIVIVDGMSQRREARGGDETLHHRISPEKLEDVIWQSYAERDFVVGVYDEAFGKAATERKYPVKQTRRVLFEKPDLWVVVDVLEPKDNASHHYQARWHLKSTEIALDTATGIAQTADEGVSNLAVIPLDAEELVVDVAIAQETPEILGWDLRKDMIPDRLPAATLLHNREGSGVQRFVTLFMPIRKGEQNPIVGTAEDGEGAWLVSFRDGTQRRVLIEDRADGAIIIEKLPKNDQP